LSLKAKSKQIKLKNKDRYGETSYKGTPSLRRGETRKIKQKRTRSLKGKTLRKYSKRIEGT
jgi:hypothetical protein